MPELLAPAGSPEGVSAAVQSGADAVYLSFGGVSGSSKYQLTEDEFGRAAEFCRVRGVKIYYCADLAPFDEEFPAALENARRAVRMGADAVIVNDLGLLWALREAMPSMPLHGGTKLGIHSADGVKIAKLMGLRRVALSPMLTAEEVRDICSNAQIETEVAVHGPLCPAFPGQCALGALSGQGSAMRDICSMPCLTKFQPGVKGRHPFALKDLCLISRLRDLAQWGVTSVRIEGRDRRPEYAAAVTGVYSKVLKTGAPPNGDDLGLLERAFPSSGFTQGYFAGVDSFDMAGTACAEPEGDTPFYNAMRRDYLNHEFQRVPVSFACSLAKGEPLRLAAVDDRGNRAAGEGPLPELAFHREADVSYLRTELAKTGGTPFYLKSISCEAQKGLYISPQDIGQVRDRLLQELMERRVYLEPRAEEPFAMPPIEPNSQEPPVLTVYVSRAEQLSQELLELAPQVVYIPIEQLVEHPESAAPFIAAEGVSVCAALPKVITDSDLGGVTDLLLKARQMGVDQVLAGSADHVIFLFKLGFQVRGDYSMNVRNSPAIHAIGGFHLKSLALSLELSASRIRSISKAVDTEAIVYGRLPLMYTKTCPVKNSTGVCSCDNFSGISDTVGFIYPVQREWDCRGILLDARKLFLARRSREYMSAGLWGVRLMFTTENPQECVAITKRYLELGAYEPGGSTTGVF